MESFINQISTPSWWISVVVVGIVINLVSSYLKPTVDGGFSNISSWWRKRSEAEKDKKQKHIEKLRGNIEEQFFAATDDLRERIRAIHLLLIGVFVMLLPAFIDLGRIARPVVMTASGLTYFLSFLVFQRGVKIRECLIEARKKDGANPASSEETNK